MTLFQTGIDVSSHQGAIDWAKVKADGTAFAILRAGYGRYRSQEDKRFAEYYRACEENGIQTGAYWYSYAQSPAEAVQEAETAMAVLKGKRFGYPIYYDVEDRTQLALSKTQLQRIVQSFCGTLEENGWFAGLYSYKSFLLANFSEELLQRYAVWVAHTGVSETNYPLSYGVWQYSHSGTVQGIRGAVDKNHAYLNYPVIMQQRGVNGYPSVAEVNPYTIPTVPVRYGDSGEEVRWLQWELTDHGFPCGPSGIDGNFGPATRTALLAYQAANGLAADGVCGPATRASFMVSPDK